MSGPDHALGMPATWTALGFLLQWLRQFRRFDDRALFPVAVVLAWAGAIPWHMGEGLDDVAMCAVSGIPAVLGGTFIGDRMSRRPNTPIPSNAGA